VDSIKNFNGSIPWRALLASMILLDSHDTARFRTIVSGDKAKHTAAMTMLMTYPGVPSVFMGDELGLEGKSGEDARATINWEDRSKWDLQFFTEVKKLAKLRRTEDAFINGGLRWVAAEDNYLAYLRESKKSKVLVVIAAKPCTVDIDLSKLGYKISKTLYGQKATGTKVKFKTNSATQGVWKLS
jgi:alpha-glucosidase